MSSAEIQGGAENYKGQYGSLKFPRYVYKEYPKVIRNTAGKVLGTVESATQERELLEANGESADKIDPLAAAQAENEELRARLALLEAGAAKITKPTAGPKTQSVEMLPESTAAEKLADKPAEVKAANPLMKPVTVPGTPQPVGSAPKLTTPVSPGV